MNESEIANKFEKLIEKGEINFEKVELLSLPNWAQQIISIYLDSIGLGWTVGDKKIDNAIIVKTDDPYIQYIDIFVDQNRFMMCINDHHDSIPPAEATIYFVSTYSDASEEKIRTLMTSLDAIIPSGGSLGCQEN